MEKEEFTRVVRQHGRRLYLIALAFTGNRTDAEDAVQNTFIKLWQRQKAFADDVHLAKWLTAVCVNESRNLLRAAKRRRSVPLEDAAGLYTFDTPRDRAVFDAVMALPPKERSAVHLFYFEDLPVKEIARTLGVSEAAVKTRLSRARKTLKEVLGDEDL